MQKIILGTYKKDKYYPKVVKATAELLKDSDEVSPLKIMIKMGNITPQGYDAWRRGQVPYLEKVFQGNLSKACRCLRIINFHVHDLNMTPTHHTYRQINGKKKLRFTKSNLENMENSYSTHYRRNRSQEKKHTTIEHSINEFDE